MKLVYICSPLAGDVQKNMQRATQYCKYAADYDVVPLAPHTIFTQYLDDNIKEQRQRALKMGLELLKRCDEIWVWGDQISKGMQAEIELSKELHIPVRYISQAEFLSEISELQKETHSQESEFLRTVKEKIGQIQREGPIGVLSDPDTGKGLATSLPSGTSNILSEKERKCADAMILNCYNREHCPEIMQEQEAKPVLIEGNEEFAISM